MSINHVNVYEPPVSCLNSVFRGIKGLVSFFNSYWQELIEKIHHMVRYGRYSYGDLMDMEWFFFNYLFNYLRESIEKQQKAEEERNRQQEQESLRQQQIMNQNYNQMKDQFKI